MDDFKRTFSQFDANGDGTIDVGELSAVLSQLGERPSGEALRKMISSADTDGDRVVDFGEFCHMMVKVRSGDETAFAAVVKKAAKIFQVEGAGGAQHTFSDEEKIAFTEHVNSCLQHDEDMRGRLPIDPHSMDLFAELGDGLIFCKLINMAAEDTVDERALNKRRNMNIYQRTENANLAINAAKAIGCQVVNVGAADVLEGRPILMLGLLWQIIKIQLLSSISLKFHPELVRLLEGTDETIEDLMTLPPEQILLRWFNFHLRAANHPRRVHNFGGDLRDSECYSALLHQLSPDTCDYCDERDPLARAEHVVANASSLGVPAFIKPRDIVSANKKLNMGFVAQLFNTCPGLSITEEELGEYDFAGLDLDDEGDTREERVFRMWMNSLGDEQISVNNLFEDVSDGLIILRVMDKVQPGIVNWRRVNMNPKNKFKCVENCNYCVVLAKQMGFRIVNIGGADIAHKNKMLILAIIWQLMRQHTLNMLTQLGGGRAVEERAVLQWANREVQRSGKTTSVRSFQDPAFSTSAFIIDLCAAIQSRAVNWEFVTPGETDEDALSNAKYAISIARRMGACVFLAPEDIVEVKAKMLMTMLASLWICQINMQNSR